MPTNNGASLGTFQTSLVTYTGRLDSTTQQVSANFGVVDMPADYGYQYYYVDSRTGMRVYSNRIQSVNMTNYRYALLLHGNGNGSYVYLRVSVDAKLQAVDVYPYPSLPNITSYNLYSTGSAQIYSVNNNSYSQAGGLFDSGVARGTATSGFGLLPFFGKWTFNATPIASGTRYSAYAPNGALAARWDCTDPNLFSVTASNTEVGFGLVANGSYRPTLDNWTGQDL